VVVADEQPLVRGGLRAILDGGPGFTVVDEAGDAGELRGCVARHDPDVILLDNALPGLWHASDGELSEREMATTTGVILLVDSDFSETEALAAVSMGMRGIMYKSDSADHLLQAVRGVADGDAVLAPRVAGQVLRRLGGRGCGCHPRPLPGMLSGGALTSREMEIFRLVVSGRTNQQIADQLFLSEATVKSHFNRICRKWGLRNRVDAVIMAYETGIVEAMTGACEHRGTG
jgi:DNA-binding NarL/FixJ family response regulator